MKNIHPFMTGDSIWKEIFQELSYKTLVLLYALLYRFQSYENPLSTNIFAIAKFVAILTRYNDKWKDVIWQDNYNEISHELRLLICLLGTWCSSQTLFWNLVPYWNFDLFCLWKSSQKEIRRKIKKLA